MYFIIYYFKIIKKAFLIYHYHFIFGKNIK